VNGVAVWLSFHDGTIERIVGEVPGDVTLDVCVDYLRNRFPGAGTGFRVTLSDCALFEYEPYDEPAIHEFAEISKRVPMVMAVECESPIVINCVMGTLRLAYGSMSISTDSGQFISAEELNQASIDYWSEWSARQRHTE